MAGQGVRGGAGSREGSEGRGQGWRSGSRIEFKGSEGPPYLSVKDPAGLDGVGGAAEHEAGRHVGLLDTLHLGTGEGRQVRGDR